MVRFQDISIRRKLVAIIMIATTTAVILVSTGFVVYERFTFQKTMTQGLLTQADGIARRSTAALSFERVEDAEEILKSLEENKHIVAACLYLGDTVYATYPKTGKKPFFPKPESNGARIESDSMVVFRDVLLDGQKIGTVYLKSDLAEMKERLRSYAAIILLMAVAGTVFTYFLSSFLQRIISRPIFQLAAAAKAISAEKNYSVRVAKHGADELGQLIDGFNGMLGQIQARDAALQEAHDGLEQRVQERTHALQEEILERRMAEASLKQQFTRISLLNQITYAVNTRKDFASIVLILLQQLEDHLPVDYGAAYLYNTQTDAFDNIARGPRSRVLAEKLKIQDSIAVAATPFGPCVRGELFYSPDLAKLDLPISKGMYAAGFHSCVGTPLVVENKMFGLLVLVRQAKDGFAPAELDFIRGMTAHVAMAINQARLYQDLQKAYNDLRQTQQTIMQQERLKALGQMASGIAHDVNNALSPVVGFAELLLNGENGLSESARKHLKHIRTAGEDVAHIVARLREFYRKREESDAAMQCVKMNALVEQVVEMTRPRWRDMPQAKGITIEVHTRLAAKLPELIGIESEIREALTNLVINAVDALPDGGTITIRTRVHDQPADAIGTEATRSVIVDVSDTGIGMSEETRRRCLEPFFSTKGKRGTGLGLAMVYGVMKRHEGGVDIDSTPGKGSTFSLSFPVRKDVPLSHDTALYGPSTRPMNILCIDDEPILRDLIRELLECDGHNVVVSENGESGVAAFRHAREKGTPYDVVITDLGMPYLDGRQVAKILKQESPTTPIIMLTGWGAFMKEDGSTPSEVDGVISKPPRSKEIRRALHRLQPTPLTALK